MMKYRICFLLFVFVLFSCQKEPEDIQTGWEFYNLSGKVKRMEKREGVVSDYKFGEPVFEQETSTTVEFNEYGFITKVQTSSSKKYSSKESERVITYDNPKSGYKKKESFKGTYYDGTNGEYYFLYEYDTILNRVLSEKKVDVLLGEEEISNWEYKGEKIRMSKYNSKEELIHLIVVDKSINPQSYIVYNGDGSVDYETYSFYDGEIVKKDSVVFMYPKYGSSYVSSYDKFERIISTKRLEFKTEDYRILDDGETTYEYETDSKNSTYIERQYKDLGKSLESEFKFQKNLDEIGNVIEEFKINMKTNKIEEGISYTIQYY